MCVTTLQSKVKKLKFFCIQVQVLKSILDATVHLVFSVWHHQVYPLTISRCDNNGTASPPRFVSATQETQKPFHPEFTKQSHWSRTTIKSRHVNVFKGLMKSIFNVVWLSARSYFLQMLEKYIPSILEKGFHHTQDHINKLWCEEGRWVGWGYHIKVLANGRVWTIFS